MLQFNHVIIKGFLGQEVKMDYLPSGATKGSFSVACTERWMKDGEKKEKTNWIPVTAWGKIIEWAVDAGLTKGSAVCIIGSLEEDRWEKDGKRFSKIGVKAQHIDIISKGGQDNE